MKRTVIFLCTGNSCRSQMAEGFAKRYLSDIADAFSAGVRPNPIMPETIKVMEELGIDMSQHRSKHVDELKSVEFDFVITLCDSAAESCPNVRGRIATMHIPFKDPYVLAKNVSSEEEKLSIYREVRNKIRQYVTGTLPDILKTR